MIVIWKLLALACALGTGILLAELQIYGGSIALLRPVCGAVGGSAAFLLAQLFWPAGALPLGLLAGALVYLVLEIARKGQPLATLPWVLLYGLSFWPLVLGGEETWEYGGIFAVLLLCGAMAAANHSSAGREGLDKDLGVLDRGMRMLFQALPLMALLPGVLLLLAFLLVQGTASAAAILLFCGGNIGVYLLTLAVQWGICRQTALQTMNRAMDQWQRDSREFINKVRAQRHDLNLHMNAISGLLNTGAIEECQEYVSRMVAEVNAINDIMPINDAVVGSMLLNMREEARIHGTDIRYDITYDMSDTRCTGFECNKIIGNLLQNAIDAIETPEEKDHGIYVEIFKRRGNTVITVENRFTGDKEKIARAFEPGFSTKSGHEGIGLAMVQRTVRRCGGRIYPVFGRESLKFVVNIPNTLTLEEGGDSDEHPDADS